jgi:hypothetical protein
MKVSQLEKNLALSKQQQKVDDLKRLKHYADKYSADNRQMISYDLERAEDKLKELKRL